MGGLWTAVAGGLGITLRTRIGLPGNLRVIDGLPPMPTLGYVLHAGAELQSPAIKLQADQNRAARMGARARAIK